MKPVKKVEVKPSIIKRKVACPVCGKQGFVRVTPSDLKEDMVYFCSKKCRDVFLVEKRRSKKSGLPDVNPDVQQEPLCTTCKTSYRDCERMQSEFRIIPKGAHYDKNGILVVCPKYKG